MSWRKKSFDVLPALSVRGGELRSSLRTVTVAWMYGVVWLSCISGDQMRAFAKMLGFNDFAFGLLGAIPFIATFGQLNAAVIIERTGLRKYQFLDCGTYHRLLWLMVAAIPLVMVVPSVLAVVAVLAVVGVSNFLGALSTTAWMTWMGDLIPRRIRGRYFARRAQWTQAVQIVAVIAISVVLDRVTLRDDGKLRPETPQGQPLLLWTICGLFAVGAVFGAVDILLFRRIRELLPPVSSRPRPPALTFEVPRPGRWTVGGTLDYARRYMRTLVEQLLLDPLRDRVFRSYVGYGAVLTFTQTVAGWYFWRHATEGLGFSKLGTNVLFMVIGPLAGTLTAGWWGRLQDRWGRRPVLILGTLGTMMSLVPWLFTSRNLPTMQFLADAANALAGRVGGLVGHGQWQIVRPDAPTLNYLLAAAGCVIGGSAWTGVSLAQMGVVLGFADGHGRSKYVAASSVLISMGGALGGLVGGAVAQGLAFLQEHPVVAGPFAWTNWHVTFLLAVAVRCGAMFLAVNMPDVGARPVRDVLRYLGENAYNAVFSRMFYPLRVFGWGRSGREEGPGDPGGPTGPSGASGPAGAGGESTGQR